MRNERIFEAVREFPFYYEDSSKRKMARSALRTIGSTRVEFGFGIPVKSKLANVGGRWMKNLGGLLCLEYGHSPKWNGLMSVYECHGCSRIVDHPAQLNTLFYRLAWGFSELTGLTPSRLQKLFRREPNPYTPRGGFWK